MRFVAGHGRWANTLEQRLWSRIKKGTPDECWYWTGAHTPAGYGVISVNNHMTTAHRIVYILIYGEVDDNLIVCHTCDNPPCCNPNHLFIGTHKTNAEDKVKKGRQPRGDKISFRMRGEKNPHSILTKKQVFEIRKAVINKTDTQRQLAAKHGVQVACISKIITRRTWKHI